MGFRIFKGRSPLTSKIRRKAGTSARDAFNSEFVDATMAYGLASGFLLALFLYFLSPKVMPIILGLMSLGSGAIIFIKIRRAINYKKGYHAEEEVGELLEDLHTAGASIFHDLKGRKFNIDHLIIDQTGVYVLETKYIRKPDRGDCNIHERDGKLAKNGTALMGDPRGQAARNAKDVTDLLTRLGFEFSAQPIVMIPGWYVEEQKIDQSAAWVMNPKRIFSKIRSRPKTIDPERLAAMSKAIETISESDNPLIR